MQAERHDGDGLKYMTILPDGYDPGTRYPLVIMLHGFGANMQDQGERTWTPGRKRNRRRTPSLCGP